MKNGFEIKLVKIDEFFPKKLLTLTIAGLGAGSAAALGSGPIYPAFFNKTLGVTVQGIVEVTSPQ